MARYRDDEDDRDDDRDDRRRRSRDDRDEEDRPRRRSGRGAGATSKRVSVLGVFALVIAIPSVIMAFVPCLNVFAIGSGLLAALLGVIGLVTAKGSNGQVGSGLPLTGLILGAVSAVIAVVMLFVYMAIAAALPTTPSPSLTTPADVTITAVQLDTEYEQNVAAADAKYKGKVVEVTGSVQRVSDEIKRFRLTVELVGAPGSTVDCDFDTTDRSSLAALTPGVTTTIRGKCIGRRTVDGEKWVTLEKCVVVPPESRTDTKPTGSPATTATTGSKPGTGAGALKVTAADLAKAYADDEEAADKKYKGKVIEVSGQVYKSDTGPVEVWYINLGTEKKDAECRFKPGTLGVRELDLMDKVIVRGKCIGLDDNRATLEDCSLVK